MGNNARGCLGNYRRLCLRCRNFAISLLPIFRRSQTRIFARKRAPCLLNGSNVDKRYRGTYRYRCRREGRGGASKSSPLEVISRYRSHAAQLDRSTRWSELIAVRPATTLPRKAVGTERASGRELIDRAGARAAEIEAPEGH